MLKIFVGDAGQVEKEFRAWETTHPVRVTQVLPACSVALLPMAAPPSRGNLVGLAPQVVQVSQVVVYILTVLYEGVTEVDGSPKNGG